MPGLANSRLRSVPSGVWCEPGLPAHRLLWRQPRGDDKVAGSHAACPPRARLRGRSFGRPAGWLLTPSVPASSSASDASDRKTSSSLRQCDGRVGCKAWQEHLKHHRLECKLHAARAPVVPRVGVVHVSCGADNRAVSGARSSAWRMMVDCQLLLTLLRHLRHWITPPGPLQREKGARDANNSGWGLYRGQYAACSGRWATPLAFQSGYGIWN